MFDSCNVLFLFLLVVAPASVSGSCMEKLVVFHKEPIIDQNVSGVYKFVLEEASR